MEAVLGWAQALGFPAWALVILLAWQNIRTELRNIAKEMHEARLETEKRITWLEATQESQQREG